MSVLRVVNFGTAKTGLSTVGFSVYGADGTLVSPRTTSGVKEIGTGTGIYAAQVGMPDYDCVVLWDTGDASVRYSTEDYQQQIATIADQTGQIQKIYNSIKNQGEFMATLMDKLGLLEKNEGLQKISQKVDVLAQRDNVSITNIEEAFSRAAKKVTLTVTPAEVHIPEVQIPDYSAFFSRIEAVLGTISEGLGKIPKESPKIPEIKDYAPTLEGLRKEVQAIKTGVDNVPKEQKEYKPNFDNMISMLNAMQSNLAKSFDDKAKDLREQILKVQGIFSRFDGLLNKIGELKNKVAGLDVNDKEMIKAKNDINKEIKILKQMLDPVYQSRQADRNMILMSLGNKING